MLLPNFIHVRLPVLRVISLVLVGVLWLARIPAFSLGALRPGHFLILEVLTLVGLVVVALPTLLGERGQLGLPLRALCDLQVVFSCYALLFLLVPAALAKGTLDNRLGWLGLLFVGIGTVSAYLPPNSLIGVRLPWTRRSPAIWYRTNRLSAQILLVVGLSVGVAAVGGASLAVSVLFVGAVVLAVVTWTYSRNLAKREP